MPLFKIRDASGESKFVIAASSLEELKIKGQAKLSLKCTAEKVIVCLEDESVVEDEDVFKEMPSNTSMVLLCEKNRFTSQGSSSHSRTSSSQQQRITFEGATLGLRPPTEEVFINTIFLDISYQNVVKTF